MSKRRKNRVSRSKRKARAKTKATSQDWRRSKEWHQARKECLKLHDNTCFISGEKCDVHELDVHHIKDASTYPELRYDQNNLIAVKRPLHKYYHRSLGGFNKTTNRLTLMMFKATVRGMIFTKKIVDKAKIKALIITIITLLYLVGSEITHGNNIMIVENIIDFLHFIENIDI